MGPAHFGVAFAAKSAAPKVSLLALLVASQALDLLSFGFGIIGMEKFAASQIDLQHGLQVLAPGSIPWSHGLFMSTFWSILFGAIAYLVTKDWPSSIVLGLVVFSHWVLDFIVHSPDLPLFFTGSPEVGLGLWTSGPGFIVSIVLELAILFGGIAIYVLARRRKSALKQV